jgi:hypothetical protein
VSWSRPRRRVPSSLESSNFNEEGSVARGRSSMRQIAVQRLAPHGLRYRQIADNVGASARPQRRALSWTGVSRRLPEDVGGTAPETQLFIPSKRSQSARPPRAGMAGGASQRTRGKHISLQLLCLVDTLGKQTDWGSVPLVVLSSAPDAPAISRRLGAHECLAKRFDFGRLLAAVERAAQR